MTEKQKLYIQIKKLNEIIETPSNIFEEDMARHLQNMYDCNVGIEIPRLKAGIDYKMSEIKLCAKNLQDLIS